MAGAAWTRRARSLLVVPLAAALVLSGSPAAQAQEPIPTPTSTPTPSATPTPTAEPTTPGETADSNTAGGGVGGGGISLLGDDLSEPCRALTPYDCGQITAMLIGQVDPDELVATVSVLVLAVQDQANACLAEQNPTCRAVFDIEGDLLALAASCVNGQPGAMPLIRGTSLTFDCAGTIAAVTDMLGSLADLAAACAAGENPTCEQATDYAMGAVDLARRCVWDGSAAAGVNLPGIAVVIDGQELATVDCAMLVTTALTTADAVLRAGEHCAAGEDPTCALILALAEEASEVLTRCSGDALAAAGLTALALPTGGTLDCGALVVQAVAAVDLAVDGVTGCAGAVANAAGVGLNADDPLACHNVVTTAANAVTTGLGYVNACLAGAITPCTEGAVVAAVGLTCAKDAVWAAGITGGEPSSETALCVTAVRTALTTLRAGQTACFDTLCGQAYEAMTAAFTLACAGVVAVSTDIPGACAQTTTRVAVIIETAFTISAICVRADGDPACHSANAALQEALSDILNDPVGAAACQVDADHCGDIPLACPPGVVADDAYCIPQPPDAADLGIDAGLADPNYPIAAPVAADVVIERPDPCTVDPTLPCVLPPAPVAVIAHPMDKMIDVVWRGKYAEPAPGVSVPNIRYIIKDYDRGTTWTVQANPFATTHAARLTGMHNGISYRFVVYAENAYGISHRSFASEYVMPAGVPFAPTTVSAKAGNASATVSWSGQRNNGSVITAYDVYAYPGGARTHVTSGTTVTIGGLTNGTTYYFKVNATNDVGTGSKSAPSNKVTPRAPAPPPPPPEPVATEILWGGDSASWWSQSFINSVEAYWGRLDFAGGYFGNRANLTTSYIQTLHNNGIKVLLIDNDLGETTEGVNQCTDWGCTLHGYANGANAGKNSIENARNLGAPSGVGLFLDIEGGTDVDSNWIKGYLDQFPGSGYKGGFYASTCRTCGFTFHNAFCGAVRSNPSAYGSVHLFTMYKNPGRTTRANAPEWDARKPDCSSRTWLWQYGIPGSYKGPNPPPNIDTDQTLPEAEPLLW